MIRVRAPSRLHFGLLSFGAEEDWPGRLNEGVPPARRFGGAGLMVQTPGLCLEARPASEWSAEGPLADRALAFARRFAQNLPPQAAGPLHFVVGPGAPEHAGLGTGTQLGLAVAEAVARASRLPEMGAVELARRVGRGTRSGLGVHGFVRGGFLVEGGKRHPEDVSPLVARADFPEEWQVVLALPPWGQGLHGMAEVQAFDHFRGNPAALRETDRLCRLVLLGMLPALAERDLEAFGEAVYDFNARVGEAFRPVQGGVYANPGVANLVRFVREQGFRGVGQSSWGPAVFAFAPDEERAGDLVHRIRERFALGTPEVFFTRAANRGAEIRGPGSGVNV